VKTPANFKPIRQTMRIYSELRVK